MNGATTEIISRPGTRPARRKTASASRAYGMASTLAASSLHAQRARRERRTRRHLLLSSPALRR
jgi:hypothetical protein